jgi:polysaccharide deacetylase 2 family uncharacterized protein YibQ
VTGSPFATDLSAKRQQKIPVALTAALLLLALLAGCRKRASDQQVRKAAADLAEAARRSTGGKAEITRREEGGAEGLREWMAIRLGDATRVAALERALDAAAARNRLAHAEEKRAPGELRLSYRQAGRITQRIGIFWAVAPAARAPGPAAPRLAIIIDDLGYDPGAAEAVLRLRYPLTVSVLPDLPHSREIAEEAHARGYQVLLHLPMEPESPNPREAKELRPGMGQAEVTRAIATMLATVPPAVGVNNHEGSLATADPALMAETMRVLRARHLFFIDSRTTVATVAYEAARQAGVPAAYRKVFLDDAPNRAAVLRQLERAARLAREQGWSIAIGHPHSATLAALREALPELERENIRLVFASELAR